MEGVQSFKLHIIFVIDVSGSMHGTRITQVNTAMPDLKDELLDVAKGLNTKVILRILKFSDTNQWVIGDQMQGQTLDEHFTWTDLSAGGGTKTADALKEVSAALNVENMGARSYKPIVILITDGASGQDITAVTEELKNKFKGSDLSKPEKVLRVAIGVQDADEDQLRKFATVGVVDGKDNSPFVFQVQNANDLSKVIKKVSVASLHASIGKNAGGNQPVINVDMI
ncbi:MAG: VWA domain-containing protein [Clostridiaceae bacterium]|jgi:uncharacterized protein YegL|nr:VWA domain-containing protein [Clostridiaceae bacterium]